jgi:hypothetical protein
LPTAWPKLNTGPWPNQTKALAELRRKCGKCLANSSALQNSSALRNYHFAARKYAVRQATEFDRVAAE